jgi:hypothetical protein
MTMPNRRQRTRPYTGELMLSDEAISAPCQDAVARANTPGEVNAGTTKGFESQE